MMTRFPGLFIRPTLGRSIVVGCGLMVLMLAIDAAISFRNIQSLHTNANWVLHTHEVEQLAADLLNATFDAVLSQRGFLYRGREESLANYRAAKSKVAMTLQDLEERLQDSPAQLARVKDLAQRIQLLIADLEGQFALLDQGLDREKLISQTPAPQARLSEIQQIVEELRRHEDKLLTHREEQHRNAYVMALITAMVSLILGLVLFAGIIELIRRNMKFRLQEEVRLNIEREQLAVTLASIGESVFSTDRLMNIVQMNDVAERFTGWSRAEAQGKPLPVILHLFDEETLQEVINPARRVIDLAQSDSSGPLLCRSADGSERLVTVNASPILSAQGAVTGAVIALRDVTDSRREELAKEEHRRLLALRAELGSLTMQPADTVAILQQVTEAITGYAETSLAAIWIAEEPNSRLELTARAGDFRLKSSDANDLPDPIQHVIQTQTSWFSNDRNGQTVDSSAEPRFMAAYPLRAENRLAGLLVVYKNSELTSTTTAELEAAAALLTQFLRGRAAERARQQSLMQLRQVIDSMFAFVGILSPDGTTIEANRVPLEAAGLAREDVIGRKFWECPWWSRRPDVQTRLQEAFQQAAAGQVVRFDVMVDAGDDSQIVIDLMLQPVYDVQGQLLFVIPSGVDITDRKHAEDELAKSQEFLRSALNSLSSHIAVLDEAGVILGTNRAWKAFSRNDNARLPFCSEGENYLQACAACFGSTAEAAATIQGIRDVISGESTTFTNEVSCEGDQETYWFQLNVSRFSGNGPVRVVVAHENITARKLADRAILHRSQQLQRLADVALRLSAAQDVQQTLEIVTRAARDLMEADEAETIQFCDEDWESARRCTDCHPDLASWLQPPQGKGDAIRNSVRIHGRPLRISHQDWMAQPEYRTELGDRTPPRGGCVVAPLSDLKGKNLGLIQLCGKASGDFTAEDEAILVQLAQMASVTLERARLYEDIREADHRKDEFLATLAHELRNPLSALTAGTQLIRMRPDKTAQVAESAELVMRQCTQLSRLVDDLLDVSRISRGKLNLQMTHVCLQQVALTAIESALPVIEDGRHKLTTHISDQMLYVRGDQARLAQVLANLLVNSAKYTPPGGQIELVIRRDDHHALLEVCDNGIGIPPEMIDRIFDKFTQIDGSHSRTQGGLGIGLTLAKTLVQLHAGTIQALSPGEGRERGSIFLVRLPLIAAPETEKAAGSKSDPVTATQADPPIPTRKLLVVDDNRAAAYLLSQLLITLHQNVKTTSNARDALTQLTSYQPDIVISDISMPEIDGYDLARKIRGTSGIQQPVLVALTGHSQASDRLAATEAGFDRHLTKPVDLEHLKQLLVVLKQNQPG